MAFGKQARAANTSTYCIAGVTIAALWVAVWLVFRSTLAHDLLQWDDQLHLTQNPFLQLGQPDRYSHFWREPYAKLYIPITYDVWAWIYAHSIDANDVFSPRLLHLANLLAHGIAAMLVFMLIARLLCHGRIFDVRTTVAAALGAALFAFHPLQVESVAWISELRGLLAADFAIAAMLAYVVAIDARSRAARIAVSVAGPLLLIAATLCKPSVAAVPIMLGVIDLAWFRRPTRRVGIALIPWLLIAGATFVLMHSLQNGDIVIHVPLWRRPFVAGDALAFYVGRLIWPFDLAADYSRTPALAAAMPWFWVAWLVPTAIGVVLWRFPHRVPLMGAGLFFAALLPVLGLVPFDFQRLSTVADRYAYLAMLAPAIALSCACLRFWRPQSLASASIFLVCLALRSSDQLDAWRDGHALWTHALDVNPRAVLALCNLGDERATAGDPQGARQFFERALAISPTVGAAHFGIADLYVKRGDPAGALERFDRAATLNADDPTTRAQANDGAGSMLSQLGKLDDAEARYRAAVAATPDYADAWNDLGALLLDRNRPREGLDAFDRAIALRPMHPLALLNAATAYERLGDSASADAALHRAVERLPRESLPLQRLGGRALDAGDVPAAIGWYRAAFERSPNDPDAINNLGRALAVHGDLDEAIPLFDRAATLRPEVEMYRKNLEAARRERSSVPSVPLPGTPGRG